MSSLVAQRATGEEATMKVPPVVRGAHRRTRERFSPTGLAAQLAVLAALQTIVIIELDLLFVRPVVAVLTFVVLPTWVVHRRVYLRFENGAARAAYALGLSLLALLVVGFAANTVLPGFGIERPLAAAPLGVTWLLVDAALLAWRPWIPLLPEVRPATIAKQVWDLRVEPAQALGALALVVAVVGAVRLNNGLGGHVAIIGHLLALAAFALLVLRRGTLGRDVRTLFLVSLALLLATSLRGWGITGHDIQAEYYVYQLTADAQHWSMELLQNAYTACLSVTLLPVLLSQVSGLDAVAWFKVGLQVAFAAVPAIGFLTFRRFVSRRLALLAVAVVIAFPTFHVDMPYLVRQELAYLFLALILLAATEPRLPIEVKRGMVVALGAGLVMSHYSTTYLFVGALVAGLVALGVAHLLVRLRGWTRDERPLVLLHPGIVLILAAMAFGWTGPVTGTGGHPLQVAQDAIESVLGKSESQTGSNDRRFFILGGQEETARERMDDFVAQTMEARKDYPKSLAVFPSPGPSLTEPQLVAEDEAPLTPVGEALDKVGVEPGGVVDVLRMGAAIFVQLLIGLGVVWLLRNRFRTWRGRAAEPETADVRPGALSPEVIALVLGTMGALGLVVVVPSLSVEYGVLRAFLQSALVVAPVAAIGLWWALTVVRRASTGWLLGVAMVMMLVLTSAGTALVGGGPAKLALANTGTYHDRYVVTDSDGAAAEWIAQAPDLSGPVPKVLAPRNEAIRLVNAGVDREEIHDRSFPTILNVGSYFFADNQITQGRVDTLILEGDRVSYRYPLERVDDKLELVYSAGHSRVYR